MSEHKAYDKVVKPYDMNQCRNTLMKIRSNLQEGGYKVDKVAMTQLVQECVTFVSTFIRPAKEGETEVIKDVT